MQPHVDYAYKRVKSSEDMSMCAALMNTQFPCVYLHLCTHFYSHFILCLKRHRQKGIKFGFNFISLPLLL